MAAFGAERKLLFEVNCFRFCPKPAISTALGNELSGGKGAIRLIATPSQIRMHLLPGRRRNQIGVSLLAAGQGL